MNIDFIIVGAMKAGTSSLSYHLNNHSDICTSGRNALFDNDKIYSKGNEHYLKLIKKYDCTNDANLIGEKHLLTVMTQKFLRGYTTLIRYKVNMDIKKPCKQGLFQLFACNYQGYRVFKL
ncbi:MAG: hypothetical protein R2741_08100 [Methanolobus sp.]